MAVVLAILVGCRGRDRAFMTTGATIEVFDLTGRDSSGCAVLGPYSDSNMNSEVYIILVLEEWFPDRNVDGRTVELTSGKYWNADSVLQSHIVVVDAQSQAVLFDLDSLARDTAATCLDGNSIPRYRGRPSRYQAVKTCTHDCISLSPFASGKQFTEYSNSAGRGYIWAASSGYCMILDKRRFQELCKPSQHPALIFSMTMQNRETIANRVMSARAIIR
jgi:hypothetical protein